MRDSHSAIEGGRWNEALNDLEAAQAKSPLTAFDLKSIYDFKAFAYIKIAALELVRRKNRSIIDGDQRSH